MKLLLTEKDPLVRRWLGVRAEELGIQLRFALSGKELMEAVGGPDSPDCVVMDASTGAGSEGPLWCRLRETSNVPILVYSSSNKWQTVAEQAGASVDGFIPRPFTAETMVCAARQAASRRALT
jgi:DNA-binding response OmpR family regulator